MTASDSPYRLSVYAQTDKQALALAHVTLWSESLCFPLTFGEAIGAAPHKVVLDHEYHDNLVVVDEDGAIFVYDEPITCQEDFCAAIAALQAPP
jgi:hypothetical protein